MDKIAYEKIHTFCIQHKEAVSEPQRDYIVRKFCDSFFKTIDVKAEEKGNDLTQQEVTFIRDALLSEETLNNSLSSANNYFARVESDYLDGYKKTSSKVNFWKSVWSSVVASFLYSILVVLAFLVASEQIGSWLSSLPKEKIGTQVEQQQSGNKGSEVDE